MKHILGGIKAVGDVALKSLLSAQECTSSLTVHGNTFLSLDFGLLAKHKGDVCFCK